MPAPKTTNKTGGISRLLEQARAIQRGEIVLGSFRAAEQAHAAILVKKQFGATQLSIIIIAHGAPVCPGVVDYGDIPDLDGG
jgi:recombinational DNA repair protein RecR